MARKPTTHDPFNAIAEPRRRELLEAMGTDELTVTQIVERLGWNQPMVSKHLGVLKQVGLVSEKRVGRQRLYRAELEGLKPIDDWLSSFAQSWSDRFDRLDEVLQEIQEKEN